MSTRNKKKEKMANHVIGLSIGSDAVGYAVVNEDDTLLKYKREPMWGTTMFEPANQKEERKLFRSERRRLDRSQQRVLLTQEIFAKEIAKVDEDFFLRIKEGALYREDTTTKSVYHLLEGESETGELAKGYTDQAYHEQYPTIHHLILDLMTSEEKRDIRLIYLAVEWLMKHRGHFLNGVDKKNAMAVLNFDEIYEAFEVFCVEHYGEVLWKCNSKDFADTMMSKIAIIDKEKAFCTLLNAGEKFKKTKRDIVNKAAIIKLLSGGKVKPKNVFLTLSVKEMDSISLSMEAEEFANVVSELGEDGELLLLLREMYDWALLEETLNGKEHISQAKVAIYEQHKKDLAYLKGFVRKYIPEKYGLIFREEGLGNYVAYSGHGNTPRCNKQVFSTFLERVLKDIVVEPTDFDTYMDMMARIDRESFMPRQTGRDSRVIPYQLYWKELYVILTNAKKHYSFLSEVEDGVSNVEKLLSTFAFRVPYYVGPLRTDNSSVAWMVRKAEGKILPWNYEEKINLNETEAAFIDRMTNQCIYLSGEDVLPKNSFLYSEFLALEQRNKKIVEEGLVLDEEEQEALFHSLVRKKTTSTRNILTFLEREDAEFIIHYFTYVRDKERRKLWIKAQYPNLTQEQIKQICALKLRDFGFLSKRFLTEIKGVCKETGEVMTIMEALKSRAVTLHDLMSSKYTFAENVEKIQREYYSEHATNVNTLLEKMYITNSMRRPIYRTLAILSDIKTATKCEPKRIVLSMTETFKEKDRYVLAQLAASRKAPKALLTILQMMYPNTEIVYIAPGILSRFRKQYDLIRTRTINEFYHGKDAYLNIICGSGNIQQIESEKLGQIRKVLSKNNLHLTRFSFERKGGLFDQMPVKKGNGFVPRKSDLPIAKYGGYNRPTSSFFLLVKYRAKKNPDLMFMGVDLHVAEQVTRDSSYATAYAKKNIANILKKPEETIEIIGFPLGIRKFKRNTILSMDGYRMVLVGTASGKKQLMVASMESLVLTEEQECYVKRLENFIKRREEKGIDRVDRWEDEIDGARNMELYNAITIKLGNPKFVELFGANLDYLEKSRDTFHKLRLDEQIDVLMNMIKIFKIARTVGCDLSKVGGKKNSANRPLASNLSNWRKRFKDVRIIDSSPSGIFEKVSGNLLKMF